MKGILKTLASMRFSILTVTLLIFLLLVPVAEDLERGWWLIYACFIVILLSGLYSLSHQRWHVIVAIIFVLPTFALRSLAFYYRSDELMIIGNGFSFIFFMFIAVSIINEVFRSKTVNLNKINAAISAYLLIGISWAFLYAIIEYLEPNSFQFPDSTQPLSMSGITEYIYFSFVTLTTLGYGDIRPVGEIARSFAFIEAVAGQMYLAVMIARLIGFYVAQRASDE